MQKLKAVAERLTGPKMLTRAPQPTGKTPTNQSWRAAAGGRRLREMLGNAGRGGTLELQRRELITAQPQLPRPDPRLALELYRGLAGGRLELVA